MLKGLFNKIKSQRSQTAKTEVQNQKKNSGLEQQKVNTKNYIPQESQMALKKIEALGSQLCKQAQDTQIVVNHLIKKIRYWRNQNIPSIFTQILACPISHYNLLPHSKRKVKEIDLLRDPYPPYLQFMKPLLQKQLPTYNHILINHYPKGIGIMHHFDGPMYRQKVVVLSLGGPALITFNSGYSKDSNRGKIMLEDKSIHIFEQEAYTNYLHGIENRQVDGFTFVVRKAIYRKDNSFLQKQNVQNSDQSIKIQLNSLLNEANCQDQYFIEECSIQNLKNTKSILSLISQNLHYLVFENCKGEQQKLLFIDFDTQQGCHKLKGCFIFIKDEEAQKKIEHNDVIFKWKMEIQRQQRISITIRQKYQLGNEEA